MFQRDVDTSAHKVIELHAQWWTNNFYFVMFFRWILKRISLKYDWKKNHESKMEFNLSMVERRVWAIFVVFLFFNSLKAFMRTNQFWTWSNAMYKKDKYLECSQKSSYTDIDRKKNVFFFNNEKCLLLQFNRTKIAFCKEFFISILYNFLLSSFFLLYRKF